MAKKKDPKKDAKKDKKDDAAAAAEAERIGTVFIPAIEAAVQEFVAKWQVGCPGGRRGRHAQNRSGGGPPAKVGVCGPLQASVRQERGSGRPPHCGRARTRPYWRPPHYCSRARGPFRS